MIKVKKSLSLLITVFIILSNIVFAPSHPDFYEGRPIDESKEGKEYYREGQVIVYPATMGTEEERMMERFAKGDFSEEEMRRMAKSKFGKDFDEMEFKRGMMEFKERRERKEAFSYEHEGYEQRYYVGPSYEGYSKEHMVFGMVFQHIGDEIDPREIKQYCNEPEKIADIVISKLKEKVGDFQKLCNQAEEHEAKCEESAKKGCAQLGVPYVREDATELEKLQSIAYSCPVNKDAIIKACILRSRGSIGQSIKQTTESCEKMFEYEGERLLRECGRFKENQICGREKYIERCMGGIKKEDFERKCPEYPVPDCGEGSILKTKTDANGCTYYYCEKVDTRRSCDKSECGLAPGMPNYICSDGKTVAGPACKRNANGVCGWQIINCPSEQICPLVTMPTCVEGSIVQKKTDEKGCIHYYCETVNVVCPADAQQCPDGTYVQRVPPSCNFKPCPTPTCPTVQKPTCAADEHLDINYDNAGCVTSYQCAKIQSCPPAPQRPSCAEGQSMTTKHDEKGCIVGYECVSIVSTASGIVTSIANTIGGITGNAVLSTYEDFLRQCENSWGQQEKACTSMAESCDKDALIERCKQQSRKSYDEYTSRIEQHCKLYIDTEVRAAEDRCSRIDEERNRCFEETAKRCEHMKGVAEKCRETLTEENLRNFIIEEAKKRCKFKDIVVDEDDVRQADKVEIVLAILNTATQSDIEKLELFVDDLKEELKLQDTTVYKGEINPNNFGDIKLLPFVVNAKISAVASSERAKEVKARIVAGQKAEEAAGRLASLRDSDVPAEYLYIIEDKASDVLDVSEDLDDIEKKEDEKGLGYKVRRFLGLAKKAEEAEIKQLGESKEKLKNSIDALAKLADEVPSDVAKAILKEQVENLQQQQEDIEVLIEVKEKKAKGLFGLFG